MLQTELARGLAENSGLPLFPMAFLVVVGLILARYLVVAGIALGLVTLFRKPLATRRIQAAPFTAVQLRREFLWSLSSIGLFGLAVAGMLLLRDGGPNLKLYPDIGAFGLWWFWLSMPAGIVFHDFYFYWAHRFMHLPGVFERVHRVHHLSTNPSPLAAFAFHPIEALIELGGILLFATLFPVHPIALALIGFYSLLSNVLGHLGYELFPQGFIRSPALNWINTSTSHNQHHRSINYNFGLYSLIWDRIFGTLHPNYETLFNRVTSHHATREGGALNPLEPAQPPHLTACSSPDQTHFS